MSFELESFRKYTRETDSIRYWNFMFHALKWQYNAETTVKHVPCKISNEYSNLYVNELNSPITDRLTSISLSRIIKDVVQTLG